MSDAVRTVCQREMDEVRLEADESARWLRRVGEKMWSSRTGREFLTEGIKRFLITGARTEGGEDKSSLKPTNIKVTKAKI